MVSNNFFPLFFFNYVDLWGIRFEGFSLRNKKKKKTCKRIARLRSTERKKLSANAAQSHFKKSDIYVLHDTSISQITSF